ncbi:uncharacterized protein EI90DRAFT_2830021, partial [Cantharellus anzutake]|uniref:uncharacterized protein n=1 Tax=Cantharellus anzutake TaxID=1750568 RepID=UPI0019064EC6
PTSQRALKGHIIVFPTNPETLSPFLPPALNEVITPMCIVFVGSTMPTKEWLLNNAQPLIVRREKVWSALEWLISHNPLYSDVILHQDHLHQIPLHDIAPVPIEQAVGSVAGDAPGARYDLPVNDVRMPLEPSPPLSSLLQSVVVTDIDMRGSNSAEMMGHLPDPVNHYSDPHLLPLLYPTLFPYGIGGFHYSRSSPLSLEIFAKHL